MGKFLFKRKGISNLKERKETTKHDTEHYLMDLEITPANASKCFFESIPTF